MSSKRIVSTKDHDAEFKAAMKPRKPTEEDFKRALTPPSSATTRERLRFGVEEAQSIVAELPIESIEVEPQVRIRFDEEEIKALAKTIEENTLYQPIVVCVKDPVFKTYLLLAGERRYRAFKHLGRKAIPAVIISSEKAKNRYVIQLYENIHRKDLHPIEKAYGLTQYVLKEIEINKLPIDGNIQSAIRSVINKVRFKRKTNPTEQIICDLLQKLSIPLGTVQHWFAATVFSTEVQRYFVENNISIRVIEKLVSLFSRPDEEIMAAAQKEIISASQDKSSPAQLVRSLRTVGKRLADISKVLETKPLDAHDKKEIAEFLSAIESIEMLSHILRKSLHN
jgi:ParB/RepB/Spo0J family partition protein